jgi:pimeloyl-ACP methyl ester carboxylesterase
MSTFVLVHGAWHGGWCWYKVVPRLEKAGHTVLAPDLPSLGRDTTPLAGVSLDSWADFVCQILDAAHEPVILVGHSRGGIVISQAAERRPGKVKTLVYVSAFLVRNGETLLQVMREDDDLPLRQNLVTSADRESSTVKPEALQRLLYGQCADEDVALARLLLRPEALPPSATPLCLTEGNYGRLPRVYIECLGDQAIPPALQKRMYTASPCQRVISLDTDHSPFFSSPEELVAQLLTL